MCTQYAFHSGDVLCVLEPSEYIEVVLRLDQRPVMKESAFVFLLPFPFPFVFVFVSSSPHYSSPSHERRFSSKTYSVSSTFFVVARCAKMAIMRARASERLIECTFWNSPSLRSEVASSSPPTCSRAREVGGSPGIVHQKSMGIAIELWG